MLLEIEKKKNRVVFLDAVRGVAALMVLFSHALEKFLEGWSSDHFEFFNLGMAGVLAFFLVSGFVIPFSIEHYKSAKVFLINRAFRIYPLYLFIFLLSVLLYYLNVSGSWEQLKPHLAINVLLHLFFLQDHIHISSLGVISMVGGAWTLFIEIVWYFLFAGLYIMGWNKKHNQLMLWANLALLCFSVLGIVLKMNLPMGRVLLFSCFIGLYTFRYYNEEVTSRDFIRYIVISVLNVGLALYVSFGFLTNPVYTLLCAFTSYGVGFLLFGGLFLFDSKLPEWLNRILAFLGEISYSVYLVHGLLLHIVFYFIGVNPLGIFIVLITSILLAKLLYKYIEKPGVDFGKRIQKRN